jgi:hypothetical protein
MRYYHQPWNERRGDEYDNWGTSTWYFEVGEDKWVSRQIEIYENGTVLHYDQKYLEDQYGFLSDMQVDGKHLVDFVEITAGQFEEVWSSRPPFNR